MSKPCFQYTYMSMCNVYEYVLERNFVSYIEVANIRALNKHTHTRPYST